MLRRVPAEGQKIPKEGPKAMKLDIGKYMGRDLEEVPTDYLAWAMGHVALSDGMQAAVMAEYARRTNDEKVQAETPGQRTWGRVSKVVTKFRANHGL